MIPIITQREGTSNREVVFTVDIPKTDLLPYSKDSIIVHYRFEKIIPNSISELPIQKFLSTTEPEIIKFTVNEPGDYHLIGLITFNNEVM